MLTKDEFVSILTNVSEKVGDSEEVMNDLKRIQEDFDERVEKTAEAFDVDGVSYKEKYDNAQRRYRERFFTSGEEVKDDQEEDIRKDSSKLTFDSLFENRESDYKKGR